MWSNFYSAFLVRFCAIFSKNVWPALLTVDVVDLEEEEHFLAVGLVGGVLVHGVQELG
jgi:hypothetical protein